MLFRSPFLFLPFIIYYPLNKSSNADATSSIFFFSSVLTAAAGAATGAGAALVEGVESVC